MRMRERQLPAQRAAACATRREDTWRIPLWHVNATVRCVHLRERRQTQWPWDVCLRGSGSRYPAGATAEALRVSTLAASWSRFVLGLEDCGEPRQDEDDSRSYSARLRSEPDGFGVQHARADARWPFRGGSIPVGRRSGARAWRGDQRHRTLRDRPIPRTLPCGVRSCRHSIGHCWRRQHRNDTWNAFLGARARLDRGAFADSRRRVGLDQWGSHGPVVAFSTRDTRPRSSASRLKACTPFSQATMASVYTTLATSLPWRRHRADPRQLPALLPLAEIER